MDGFVFGDVRSLWPFSSANPFPGIKGIEWLRLIALSSGIPGGVVIVIVALWSRMVN